MQHHTNDDTTRSLPRQVAFFPFLGEAMRLILWGLNQFVEVRTQHFTVFRRWSQGGEASQPSTHCLR